MRRRLLMFIKPNPIDAIARNCFGNPGSPISS
jgi:hypothetical protein